MLSRSQRITTSAFATAFQNGRTLRHPLLQLKIYRRGDDDTELRAAFVVAKKLGKATLRNRVRRRVREQYRQHGARLDARLQGCDLIFMATAAAIEATVQEIDAAFDQLLPRAARSLSENKQEINKQEVEPAPKQIGAARLIDGGDLRRSPRGQ